MSASLTRAQRSALEATFPKCVVCGNVVPRDLQQMGIGKCRRHHEEDKAVFLAHEREDFIDALMRKFPDWRTW